MRIEYAVSGRAGCKGCKGKIEKGSLRYGEEGTTHEEQDWVSINWRHWDCVTSAILRKIGAMGAVRVYGYSNLTPEDKERVLLAVRRGSVQQVGPTVAAISSGAAPSGSQVPTGSAKRKREQATTSSQVPATESTSSRLQQGTIDLEETETETDNEEEASRDEVYVVLPTDVVGIRYYHGLVAAGESVTLRREPTNQYDSNAIRVNNISGVQVGHIPRHVASQLAGLLDRGLISVEGTMTQGNLQGSRNAYTLGINISIIGPSDVLERRQLEPKLIWATPRQQGFGAIRQETTPLSQTGVAGTTTSPKKGKVDRPTMMETAKELELRKIVEGMDKLDDGSRRSSLLDSLCGDDVLELPLYPNPPSKKSGHLRNDLLKHQKQGLMWCVEAENPKLPVKAGDKAVQLWVVEKSQSKSFFRHLVTKTPQQDKPILGRGGIIGDSMGLGKTLQMLSLIIATKNEQPAAGYSNSTLIVVPLSVLSNWTSQIEEHVTSKCKLSTHVYYGDGKQVSTAFLQAQDIVITTYQSVVGDMTSPKAVGPNQGAKKLKAAKKGLFSVQWKRCILDEGHTIRNSKTKTAQACFSLDAERRWVLTGTPIINNPTDLGSLLQFLRVCRPLDEPEFFRRHLTRPLSARSPEGAEVLKALMSSCCLRRTKEMQDKDGNHLVSLPPVVINVVKVELDPETREFYDAVEQESRKVLHDFIASGGNRDQLPMGINVLSLLTRLRQISLDRNLVPKNYLEDIRAAAKPHHHATQPVPVNITEEERSRLQDILALAIKDNEECPICFDNLSQPRITTCAHRFCLPCITEVISRQATCPLDRRAISLGALVEPRPDEDTEDSEDLMGDVPNQLPSPKSAHLIELLKHQPWHSKSLVFSQFTGYLDKISADLVRAGIPFVRFDGSMSAKKRQAVLEAFSVPLKKGGVNDDDETETETDTDSDEEPTPTLKGKGKGKASSNLTNGRLNPAVMLISLKSGSLGLNLTVANNVFLMDPWWQEAIESQAIDRVNRIGQKKNVTVYQMIAENTIESKVLEIQERKKELIKQAFSGRKTVETQRQKKEARLNELIELFRMERK